MNIAVGRPFLAAFKAGTEARPTIN